MPAEALQAYAYLWESGEWVLHRTHHSCAKVIVSFENGRASPRELAQLRRIVDRFRDTPAGEVKRAVEGQPSLDLGALRGIESRQLLIKLTNAGLSAHLEDASYVTYLPVSKNPSSVLVIEDDELAKAVGEEMVRRGVPVVHAESD